MLAALVVPAAMGACTDERNNFMVDDSVSFVDSDGTWAENKGYVSTPVYNEKYEFPVVKNGKGLSGTTVRIEASESALDAFNEANGTNYELLPSNCYQFTATELRFSEKEVRKFAGLTWKMSDVTALDAYTDYVIPIQLTSSSNDVPVSEDRGLMLRHLEIAKVSRELSTDEATTVKNGTFIYNGNVKLSTTVPTMDVEVKYAVDTDASLVDAYNKANGTSYLAAPAGFASTVAASSVIAAGESSAAFGCQLNPDKLLENVDKLDAGVLIPVRISAVSDGTVITKGGDVVYIPVVEKQILWSKRCKDEALRGTVKETITQVSRSKKWDSKPVLDEDGNPKLNEKGKKILRSSYSVLQDDFFNFMRNAGYTDVERGERGSTEEHLTVTQFKVQAEQQRLEAVTGQVAQAKRGLENAKAATEKQKKKLEALQKETKTAKTVALTVQEIETMGKKATFGNNITLTPDECDTLKRYAVNGIIANADNKRLKEKLASAEKTVSIWKQRYEAVSEKYMELKQKAQPFLDALEIASERVRAFINSILIRGKETQEHKHPAQKRGQDMEL